MWKNHFKVAFRLVARQKIYALTNVVSLSVGIAISLLLLMYVSYELSYDRFHQNAEEIYRVNAISFNPEENFYRPSAPAPLATLMAEEFPEVAATTRINRPRTPNNLVKANNQEFYESKVYMSDEGFFDVFSFDLVYGNETTALDAPGKVILTRSMAIKYFGRENVVGEVINYENLVELVVSGVLDDIPDHSTLDFNFIISNHTPDLLYRGWRTDWGSSNAAIYVRLKTGVDPVQVDQKFPALVEQYISDDLDKGEEYVMSLQGLTDLHLNPHVAPEQVWSVSNKKYVYILPIVGLLVLVIAAANYVNLSMARATDRLREVGIRKLMGSVRLQLMGQFLTESLFLVLLGTTLAFLLAWMALPAFNDITGSQFDSRHLFAVQSLAAGAIVWLLLSLAAGLYPAFLLSGIQPLMAISQHLGHVNLGKSGFRNVLLTFQFAIALTMIVATMVVNGQLRFMDEKSRGFDAEQVIYFTETDRVFWQAASAFKNELTKYPGIDRVSFSSGIPGSVGYGSTAQVDNDARDFEINHIMVDHDFMSLYDLKIVDGRGFDIEIPTDETSAYLINETAASAIGWDDPLKEQMRIWGNKAPVIGVVGDFHFESLKNPIGPLALHFGAKRYRVVSIKMAVQNIGETLGFIETLWGTQVPGRPFQYRFVDSRFEAYYEKEKQFAAITDLTTGFGLVLAIIGLLSLTAFLISKRAKEIGIRRVLGAGTLQVIRLFMMRMLWLFITAILIAIPGAWYGMNQWLDGFAYRINVSVLTFGVAGLLLALVIVSTIWIQVRRALVRNPVDSLRAE